MIGALLGTVLLTSHDAPKQTFPALAGRVGTSNTGWRKMLCKSLMLSHGTHSHFRGLSNKGVGDNIVAKDSIPTFSLLRTGIRTMYVQVMLSTIRVIHKWQFIR